MARARKGDEAAWAELVEATYREVYTLCLRILRDPDEAADATQEAFVRAWRGLRGFRGDARFTTWLYRVAANAALSRHRSRRRRREHETGGGDEVLAQIAGEVSTEAAAGARVEAGRLLAALERLPEPYRTAVTLRDVYGLPIEDIAARTGVTETAAKVRIHRGRKKLRDEVYPHGNA